MGDYMIKKRIKILSFIVALCIFISSFCIVAFAEQRKTTSKLRYLQEYMNTEFNYPTIHRINASGMFAVPGLEYTNLNGKGCTTMVPQGLCVAKDYILISAYDGLDLYKSNLKEKIGVDINGLLYNNESNHALHRSVIYVLSKKDKKYLTTLVLPDVNHAGGIAFDGEYVWVAKGGDRKVSTIKYSTITNAVKSGKDSVSIKYNQSISCGTTASMVTYYNNRLWVGVFNQNANGSLKGFDIYKNDNGRFYLFPYRTITLPPKANGVALATMNGKTQLVVNTSYGRNSASVAYFYTLDISKDSSLADYTTHPTLKLPPMAEEICIDGSTVYSIFESGSTTYSGVCDNRAKNIVDRVCMSSLSKFFPWTNSNTLDAPAPLPAPVNDIRLTKSTTNSVSFEWNAVEGVDGYYLYRYITASDSYLLQEKLDPTVTSYSLGDLKSATDYDFVVVPYNAIGRARTGKMLMTLTKPTSTTITSLSSSKKTHSITAKWNKVDRVAGYEIQYSTSKDFKTKTSKKIKSASTLSITTDNFKKDKKYFVRVRVYKAYGGKTYYSSWSPVKTITAK